MILEKLAFILCLLLSPLSALAQNPVGMRLVPAGEFKLPALKEKNIRKVHEFWMDEHAVTNSEYLLFAKKNPDWAWQKVRALFADKSYLEYWKNESDFGGAAFAQSPVVQVSWFAARAYCESQGKRLPTIEEWEYVGTSPFVKGESIQSLILEWYGQTASWPLKPVKSSPQNLFGIYDMHGLIWEWVEDFNSSLVTGESRADGALDKNLFCGSGAVGMDPSDYAAFMRYAFRSSLQAKYTVRNLGFRCAKNKEKL